MSTEIQTKQNKSEDNKIGFMLYWIVDIENRAILTRYRRYWTVFLACIFGVYFWRGRRPSQKYTPKIQAKNTVQYREISHEAQPSAIFRDIERGNHPE